MNVSEPLPHFVDHLLGYLYETHPTHANFDGVHTHDDLLENLSRHGIDSDVHALAGYLRRLEDIRPEGLNATERLEHRMLADCLRSRMFELEVVRTWEKNPQYYADIVASSVCRTRWGDSKKTTVVEDAPSAASHSLRSLDLVGGNPRNVNGWVENPDAATAATMALGPGIGSTRIPASTARRRR